MKDDILYLLNPHANEGYARKLWKKMSKKYSFLPKEPIDITTIDLESLIAQKQPSIIAIAGGDGTINAVCHVVRRMKHKPVLSIFPFGFGNALAYCLGVETIDKAVDVLSKKHYKVTTDLMQTNILDHDTVVFNASVGFDARVVFNRQNYKYIGFPSYIISGLKSYFLDPDKEITLTIDHKVTLNAIASSLVIANCPIIGQNYVVAPNAKLNDGLLDCTMFSTKYAYLTNLRLRGFKHPLYTEWGKVRLKAKHIKIEGEPFIQIDGDPVLQKEGIEIEILPSQITFLRNKREHIQQEYLPFID